MKQKFLGSVLFFEGKSSNTYEYVKEELQRKIENIDKMFIRNEYKLWIYKNYFIPAIIFLLTIHYITKTDVPKLDCLTNKILKKWAELPRCVPNTICHHPIALNILSMSDLYHLTHTLDYAHIRLKGDDVINHGLDAKVEREKEFSRKPYGTLKAIETYDRTNKIDIELEKHVTAIHGKVKDYFCTICEIKFHIEIDLDTHLKAVHTNVSVFACDHCEKSFGTDVALKRHVYAAHNNNNDYSCALCESIFNTEIDLSRHFKTVHTNVNDFACVLCKKSFDSEIDLNIHTDLVHNDHYHVIINVNDFACDQCKDAFSNAIELETHMGISHTKNILKSYLNLRKSFNMTRNSDTTKIFAS